MNGCQTGKILCILLVACVLMIATSSSLRADDVRALTGRTFAQLARGGLLYDNWLAERGVAINETHPAYPAAGTQKGESTWRCKECHGWDYKGKAGAYSQGSHFTGIKGIRDYANQDPHFIARIIGDDLHAFGDRLTKEDVEALALFVAYGQIDTDLYISRETKKTIGDATNGGRIYLSTCTKCHGYDGKEINFKDDKSPEYIGTLASKNPWETLHKIRWGHPGTPMISLVFLDLKEQLDVLAFCQALPAE
ncbi:MAG: hypothetical protein JSU90_04450 [Nitrospiraceae bacterium]|nr:MAG: hypothetical protein JSU90_04450 [Nitrospiraceae bacterium]